MEQIDFIWKPFKILQDETKIVETFPSYSQDIQLLKSRFGHFFRKKRQKNQNAVFEMFCRNWRTTDSVTSQMINAQLNNKHSGIFPFSRLDRNIKFNKWIMGTFEVRLWILAVTMVPISEQISKSENEKAFLCWNLVILEKIFIKIKTTLIIWHTD